MEYLSHSANQRHIGVIVLEEFVGLLASEDFIRTASTGQGFPTFMQVQWHDPGQRREEGLHLLYGKYQFERQREYSLHLFGFPDALYRNFLLSDLQFPVTLMGFVLIVKCSKDFLWRDVDMQTFEQRKMDPTRSGLAWVKITGLPFVIAATGQESQVITMDQLRGLLDLEPQIPIIPCSSKFDEDHIHLILSALVERIESGGQ